MQEIDVAIPVHGGTIHGSLTLTPQARGIVVFAHGSGSSRLSPRNQRVATALNQAGLATLMFDLLTPAEDRIDQETGEFRFDIELLAQRVIAVSQWLAHEQKTKDLLIGLFGASTGAAGALIAAAHLPHRIAAVVCRGGRPDLAAASLGAVTAPTLFIVGENDPDVLALNQDAFARLTCTKQLIVIANATHLFEEPGTLEQVAACATTWFKTYMG